MTSGRPTPYTDFSTALNKASAQLQKFYGDGELSHAFLRLSGWNFEQMQEFQQMLSEAHQALQGMREPGIQTVFRHRLSKADKSGFLPWFTPRLLITIATSGLSLWRPVVLNHKSQGKWPTAFRPRPWT
jgi:hypothetical protein